jgi:hypothetical protein
VGVGSLSTMRQDGQLHETVRLRRRWSDQRGPLSCTKSARSCSSRSRSGLGMPMVKVIEPRDHRRNGEGLQVQAHSAPHRSRRGALGRQGAFTCVRERKGDAREGRAAPHARSHRLSASLGRVASMAPPMSARPRNRFGGQSRGGWTANSASCSPSEPPKPQRSPFVAHADEANA